MYDEKIAPALKLDSSQLSQSVSQNAATFTGKETFKSIISLLIVSLTVETSQEGTKI